MNNKKRVKKRKSKAEPVSPVKPKRELRKIQVWSEEEFEMVRQLKVWLKRPSEGDTIRTVIEERYEAEKLKRSEKVRK